MVKLRWVWGEEIESTVPTTAERGMASSKRIYVSSYITAPIGTHSI